MEISLITVKSNQKELLNELLLTYEQELTGQTETYKYLESYFEDKDRFPFFILVDGDIAGFVLVNHFSVVAKEAYSIGEFFVVKKYGGQGVGKTAAINTFNSFPGKWEIRELFSNQPGQAFWRKIIKEYTNNNFQEQILDTDIWHGPIQTFNNTNRNYL
jgi:predicted acetyltransferase